MKFFSFLGKEIILGTLIALLSIFTTLASLGMFLCELGAALDVCKEEGDAA